MNIEYIPLWPGNAPHSLGADAIDQPALSLHLPAPNVATGTAVIVNPGGGYRILAADHEGLQVAQLLNRHGIAALVLRYRVGPRYDAAVSLQDGLRAVRLVRARAADWGVTRIGMLGFSAGGHLAAAVGTRGTEGDGAANDPVERHNSRPDFLVLGYPAIANEFFRSDKIRDYAPAHTAVTATTPPTFLVHTHEDPAVSPTHSLAFYQALLAAGVPAEMHIFGTGGHGLGLAPGDADLGRWPELMLAWLQRSGFLCAGTRVAVSGSVNCGERPLAGGWVRLTPVQRGAPIVAAYIHRTAPGAFVLDAAHGPVSGRHRVDVWRVSNANQMDARGAFSIDDAQHLTVHDAPEIDIQAGQPIRIDLPVVHGQ